MSNKLITAGLTLSVLLAMAAPQMPAQAVAPVEETPSGEDEIILLSPFTVDASEDQSRYQANTTLAGTRVRTNLSDVASSISVVTKKFIQDIGATSNESLLQYTTGTEVGGVYGNFGGVTASSGQYSETGILLRPNHNTRVRGLDAADNTRDFFLSDIPWDGYVVDRVDLQRGPNSILFGVGSPAGIINASLMTAAFKNDRSLETRVDEHGSMRNALSLNHVVVPKELAIRISILDERNKYQQEPAFEDDRRYYSAIRWSPKIFGASNTTDIRANYESGDINANRPRMLPPVDAISPWFYTTDPYGNPYGLNKRTFQPFNRSLAADTNNFWARAVPGRQFWQNTVGYYEDTRSGQPARYVSPMVSIRNGIAGGTDPAFPAGAIDSTIGGQPFVRPWQITSFDDYASVAGGLQPGTPGYIPGGRYYSDTSLADPTIFGFYNNLIDGDNKHEWQEWDAANVVVAQTFFDARLGFEAVYDLQRYHEGQQNILAGGNYTLSVDINSHYADGTPNPNVGRPYVAGATEDGNVMNDIDRDSVRFTAFGELRAKDFLHKDSRLARILGFHRFTGLLSEDKARTFSRNWVQDAADTRFASETGESVSLASHNLAYNWQVYLGDSLANAASASGANIDRIRSRITSPVQATVRRFDNRWARSLVPGSYNYVNPADPYTFTDVNGNVVDSTQSENPANYFGWTDTVVGFRNADRDGKDGLYTSSARTERQVKSRGITWQGFFFDGNFVPVFGWRRDEVSGRKGDASIDSVTGIANLDYDYDPKEDSMVAGESKSWGGVLKLPYRFRDRLPGRTGIDVFVNRSENFKADVAREDVFGQKIENPNGTTKEHGFVISTLEDKVSLKVTWYETKVSNATMPGDTGFNFLHWAVPAWGIAHAANLQAGMRGANGGMSWMWDYPAKDENITSGPGTPAWDNSASAQNMRNILQAWRQIPLTQEFFNSYGRELAEIDVAKVQAGDFEGAWPKWAQGRGDPQPGSSINRVAAGDTTSKGVEFELYAQPLKGWNVTANVTKTRATISSVSPTIATYMDAMTEFMAGDAGSIRLWGGNDPLRLVWDNEVVTRYQILLSQIGQSASEISPWRVNLVSSYDFSEGPLRGFFIGGAYRWEDKHIMRYGYDEDEGALDVSQPIYGPSEDHFDAWVGYGRRILGKYDWRLQLNVRNIGESDHLVPISYQPNGAPALSRIQEGMTWAVTNSIRF